MNLAMLGLLVGCHGDNAETEANPFDDFGPYKNCEQDIVYTEYDESELNAEPIPVGEAVTVYTAQGGPLQRDEYGYDSDGTLALDWTTRCSYEESTHAPLTCEIFYEWEKKPGLYLTETYAYRADGFLAWQSDDYPSLFLDVTTVARDASDRVVRVDTDRAFPDDDGSAGEVDGVPDWSDVWSYVGDDTPPSEIATYREGIVDDDHLTGIVRYTVENDLAVHGEAIDYAGNVTGTADYTYDDDGHLLTNVGNGGWEIDTFTWDGDFLMSETHEVAWKDLSDVRTDSTADYTYDCEGP
jgi:hypothetical protein